MGWEVTANDFLLWGSKRSQTDFGDGFKTL